MKLQMRQQRHVICVVVQRYGEQRFVALGAGAAFGIEYDSGKIHETIELILSDMLPVEIRGEQSSVCVGEIEFDEVERGDACADVDLRGLDRAAAGYLRKGISFVRIQRA